MIQFTKNLSGSIYNFITDSFPVRLINIIIHKIASIVISSEEAKAIVNLSEKSITSLQPTNSPYNEYLKLMGVPYSETEATTLQYLVFDGILLAAEEGDTKSVLFSLDVLSVESPENLEIVITAAIRIAKDDPALISQLKERLKSLSDQSMTFIDKNLPEDTIEESSSMNRFIKFAVISVLLLGGQQFWAKPRIAVDDNK